MNKGCNVDVPIWSFFRTFEIKMNLSIADRRFNVHDLGTMQSI